MSYLFLSVTLLGMCALSLSITSVCESVSCLCPGSLASVCVYLCVCPRLLCTCVFVYQSCPVSLSVLLLCACLRIVYLWVTTLYVNL